MNEKLIERKLRDSVKKLGGTALKYTSPYDTGMPDRLVLMPGGRAYFVELKTTGKKPTALQSVTIKRLQDLGFIAVVIDSQDLLDCFIERIRL